MRLRNGIGFIVFGFILLYLVNSCRKDGFISDPSKKLVFSTFTEYNIDTLTFDTVFTSLGSTTKFFKIVNTHNQDIQISEIKFKNPSSSTFSLNIDGITGNSARDVIVPAKDSIYVFVTVTVDPTGSNLPFVYSEDIEFIYNTNIQTFNVMAWGQNAYFHYGEAITSSTTWLNDKPHVLISKNGIPGVIVSSGVTLTIQPNCKIYCNTNAGIYCWGTLNINSPTSTKADSVVFQGLRLERAYDDLPGQWGGIFLLRGSSGAKANIYQTTINESSSGIFAGSDTGISALTDFTVDGNRPELNIANCIISNTGFGEFGGGAFKFGGINSFNSKIRATNNIIYNSTGNAVLLVMGGDYKFLNCTFYNGGSAAVQHKEENILVSDFIQSGTSAVQNDFDICEFNNCICYGSLEEELSLNQALAGSPLNIIMQNCNIRTKTNIDSLGFVASQKNNNPLFEDAFNGDFNLKSTSPCIDAGNSIYTTGNDMNGSSRPIGVGYDIGALEKN
jgi:hypothetical protein